MIPLIPYTLPLLSLSSFDSPCPLINLGSLEECCSSLSGSGQSQINKWFSANFQLKIKHMKITQTSLCINLDWQPVTKIWTELIGDPNFFASFLGEVTIAVTPPLSTVTAWQAQRCTYLSATLDTLMRLRSARRFSDSIYKQMLNISTSSSWSDGLCLPPYLRP